jgi:hypothetical protein
MVYHIELWFIYGLSMFIMFTIWKTIQDSPCPSVRSSLLAPLNITFGQSDAFTWPRSHGTGLVERQRGWWNGTLMVVPDARTCCESYIYLIQWSYIHIYTYVICLCFVYYLSVFMHWKHLHAHFSANFIGAIIEERFISAMAMIIRWGRARMVNTKRSCLVLGGRKHHLLIFTSDQSQVCSGRRWHGGTTFAGNYWW